MTEQRPPPSGRNNIWSLLGALLLLWVMTYGALRVSGLLVRSDLLNADTGAQHSWVQFDGDPRSWASWAGAVVYWPLWQLEFRLRGVYVSV